MSTTPCVIHVAYVYGEKILPRRMSTIACSFASHFGQEMAQNADFPISCKNFSGVIPPNPRPVLGHRAVLFPDSRCFGSHNFQIVPARLETIVNTNQCCHRLHNCDRPYIIHVQCSFLASLFVLCCWNLASHLQQQLSRTSRWTQREAADSSQQLPLQCTVRPNRVALQR